VSIGFNLDPRLTSDTLPVSDLPISIVRLMNDARFPWVVLVPRRSGASEILDLSSEDRHQLFNEIVQVSSAVKMICTPKKLNVATIGNIVPQLHVHVVARNEGDAAWPRPVWGVGTAEPYTQADADAFVTSLKRALAAESSR
jgi:diadenosine tetraphosphate (Ap4A) HIT family hydrolase